MRNSHRKHWVFDKRHRKWMRLSKILICDWINGKYDIEPNGVLITEDIVEILQRTHGKNP